MAERTCLACRKVLSKDALLRYVASPDGHLTVDYTGRLPGRGAYTCVTLDCLETALKKRAFGRALKTELQPVELAELTGQLKEALETKIASLIGMGRKSQAVVSGTNEIQGRLGSRQLPGLVIVATDLSPGLYEKIKGLAQQKEVPFYRMFSKDDLGRLLGKGLRSALAFEPGGLTDRLIAELVRYQTVSGEK